MRTAGTFFRTSIAIGGVLGPILAGWVFDTLGSYLVAFVIFSGICYTAAILSCLLKAPDRGLHAAAGPLSTPQG